MKALIYVDLCVARKYAAQYLLIGLMVSSCTLIGMLTSADVMQVDAYIVASGAAFLVMIGYFMLYAFFGADEMGGWQQGRAASLPVTARQVVQARFLVVTVVYAVVLVLAVPAGMLITLVVSLLKGQAVPVFALDANTLLALAAVAGIALVMAGVQMAFLFALGMQRARAATFLPLLLIMLLIVPGVSDALKGAVAAAAETVAGMPVVALAAALVAVAAAAYLACLKVAETLYARREL